MKISLKLISVLLLVKDNESDITDDLSFFKDRNMLALAQQ
jgi:hypothetical protein